MTQLRQEIEQLQYSAFQRIPEDKRERKTGAATLIRQDFESTTGLEEST